MTAAPQTNVQEDVWIPTSGGQCYCMCGIKVRRQNGVITEPAGNPRHLPGEAVSVLRVWPRPDRP
jgi:hypothetical protein